MLTFTCIVLLLIGFALLAAGIYLRSVSGLIISLFGSLFIILAASFLTNGFGQAYTTTTHKVTVKASEKDIADTLIANGWNCQASLMNGGWVCTTNMER